MNDHLVANGRTCIANPQLGRKYIPAVGDDEGIVRALITHEKIPRIVPYGAAVRDADLIVGARRIRADVPVRVRHRSG